jgi:hypothetical protein
MGSLGPARQWSLLLLSLLLLQHRLPAQQAYWQVCLQRLAAAAEPGVAVLPAVALHTAAPPATADPLFVLSLQPPALLLLLPVLGALLRCQHNLQQCPP